VSKYVITINRQFGSLGRPIAQKLSELLDIDYYDRDIVEAAAKELGMQVPVISSEEEIAKSRFFSMAYPLGMGTNRTQDLIFKAQEKIINTFANKSSCIIVGRCSDFVLENTKDAMHVFIYAPYQARLRNCIDALKMSEIEAKKMIERVDRARDLYHKSYAGYLPSDCTHKHMLIDSDMFGVDGTASVLKSAVEKRFG
jgi:cytidylate kinase